ncbi:DUF6907 domain-containing protein [Actinacidiphila sp. ITFR-21]|uniref:DUF6907 domain-containing protein n=1 Tax=Actinacidiphila sp. ITFR-21 TaxID=3075199 RepID=UPI00288BEF14|nr:hypothetical protein [Streptomyces sp. ITFR-21]WNI17061.1 hypothetical protein RLT57_17075 [Streptomyces sp. ITFR-21]
MTTPEGVTVSGHLPAWAQDDPSRTGVPLRLLPIRLADISHQAHFPGQTMQVVAPDAHGAAGEETLFDAVVECCPYAEHPEPRVPVANIQVHPEHWILGLTPDGLADLASQLRRQADRLDNDVRPALITARTDWARHHPPAPTPT